MPFWGKKKEQEKEPELIETLRPKAGEVNIPPGGVSPEATTTSGFRTKAYVMPVGKRDSKTVFLVGKTEEESNRCRVAIVEFGGDSSGRAGREIDVSLIEGLQMAANSNTRPARKNGRSKHPPRTSARCTTSNSRNRKG